MKRGRQAFPLCHDAAVAVEIKIFQEFLLEVLHRIEYMEIKQFTFKKSNPAHALPDAFLPGHALIIMQNQTSSVRYLPQSLVEYNPYHAQNRPSEIV